MSRRKTASASSTFPAASSPGAPAHARAATDGPFVKQRAAAAPAARRSTIVAMAPPLATLRPSDAFLSDGPGAASPRVGAAVVGAGDGRGVVGAGDGGAVGATDGASVGAREGASQAMST